MGVTQNINTSPEILKRLATSSNCRVRQGVAEHHKTPLKILDKLKSDKDRNVRLKIAENPNISLEIIEYLAKDSITKKSEIPVTRLGRQRMDIIITGVHYHYVRAAIAKRNDLTEKIADILSKDDSSDVRQNIAANPNVPIEIIKLLSKDSNPNVHVEAVKMLMYHRFRKPT